MWEAEVFRVILDPEGTQVAGAYKALEDLQDHKASEDTLVVRVFQEQVLLVV
jgi:hypothetical protein